MYKNSSVAEDQPRLQNVEQQAVASGETDSGSEGTDRPHMDLPPRTDDLVKAVLDI
jgi:hypothetical protein